MSFTNPYFKAIVAAIGAAAAIITQTVGPEGTAGQIATIVIAVLTALGVYEVPNRPTTPA